MKKTSERVYVGIKGSVVALDSATGELIWSTRLKGYDFVSMIVEENRIFATAYGELFCLDVWTGDLLWHNQLKGYGMGLATIATQKSPVSGLTTLTAEKRRRDEQAASSATTTHTP